MGFLNIQPERNDSTTAFCRSIKKFWQRKIQLKTPLIVFLRHIKVNSACFIAKENNEFAD
jgi:hypothetical protein